MKKKCGIIIVVLVIIFSIIFYIVKTDKYTGNQTEKQNNDQTVQHNSQANSAPSTSKVNSYSVGNKTIEILAHGEDPMSGWDVNLVNSINSKKLLLTLPSDPTGGNTPRFGTTSIPSIVYGYLSSGDSGGFSNKDLFVDLTNGTWLLINSSNGNTGGSGISQFTLTSSLLDKDMNVQFEYQGTCRFQNVIQDGKNLVKILAIKAVNNGSEKSYTFPTPIQLTCHDPGGIGSDYKENFGMSIYGIDPSLYKLGVTITGKSADGTDLNYQVGYDLRNQGFVSWQSNNKGFDYSK